METKSHSLEVVLLPEILLMGMIPSEFFKMATGLARLGGGGGGGGSIPEAKKWGSFVGLFNGGLDGLD